MTDDARTKRIILLLKIWFFITETGLHWPKVKMFVEQQINEELASETLD